jgi:hypothetical protein
MIVMRCAFVVLLEPKSSLPHELEGWVEEVDTGIELRFHSKAELILFLQLHRYAPSGKQAGRPGFYARSG